MRKPKCHCLILEVFFEGGGGGGGGGGVGGGSKFFIIFVQDCRKLIAGTFWGFFSLKNDFKQLLHM